MKKITTLIYIISFIVALGILCAYAETIHTKDGRTINQRIVQKTKSTIWYEVNLGASGKGKLGILIDDVEKVLDDDGTVSSYSPTYIVETEAAIPSQGQPIVEEGVVKEWKIEASKDIGYSPPQPATEKKAVFEEPAQLVEKVTEAIEREIMQLDKGAQPGVEIGVNIVEDGAIRIDGNPKEWVSMKPVIDEIGKVYQGKFLRIDTKKLWICHDKNNIYFLISSKPGMKEWHDKKKSSTGFMDIYIDSDGDQTTGSPDAIGFGKGQVKGAEYKIWMVIGISSGGAEGDRHFSKYKLLSHDEKGRFSISNDIFESDSNDKDPMIADANEFVEFAIPKDKVALSYDNPIKFYAVEPAASFDKDGATLAAVKLDKLKGAPIVKSESKKISTVKLESQKTSATGVSGEPVKIDFSVTPSKSLPKFATPIAALGFIKSFLPGKLQGVLFAVIIGSIVFVISMYAYFSICLQVIAKKTDTPYGWLAWIPLINMFLMVSICRKPKTWSFLLIGLFVSCALPVIGAIASLGITVISLILWYSMAEARDKPGWVGILIIVPLVNLFIPGIIAFKD
ncbi:hypothetical protein ACFL0T_06800 [Candidatus Omnitrophota bacterium]